METRRIQKVGQGTLSVSLPKKWINTVGAKRGDVIYLNHEIDGSLRIRTSEHLIQDQKLREYSINCDVSKEPKLLERLIVGCYLQGVDVVTIFSSQRIAGEQIEEIRNIAQRLIGLSIVEETPEKIILNCSLDPSRFKIYLLVQRMATITSTMLIEALDALAKLTPEIACDVIKRENEANNIYWLTTRLILSAQHSSSLAEAIGLETSFGPTCLRLVSKNLEGIADCCEHIAKITLDLIEIQDSIDSKELEKLRTIDRLTRAIFRQTVDSIFSEDTLAANKAINLRDQLSDEVEARMRTAAIPYFRALAIMLASIAERCASIATTAINTEIQRSTSFPT